VGVGGGFPATNPHPPKILQIPCHFAVERNLKDLTGHQW